MCKLSSEEKEYWGKELSELLQERMGCSAGRLEEDWKRWTLKDFSKWRCGLGGGENSWPGTGTGVGGTAQAKAWGHKMSASSVTATAHSGLPLVLTAAPEGAITAAVSQDRKFVSERDRHLLPVAQLVSGRAESSVLSPALCLSKEAGRSRGGAERAKGEKCPEAWGLLPPQEEQPVMVAELESTDPCWSSGAQVLSGPSGSTSSISTLCIHPPALFLSH